MKILMLVVSSSLLVVACGQQHRNKPTEYTVHEEYSIIPSMQVGSPIEVRRYLAEEIRRNRLWNYNHTKWYMFNGAFLFKSEVIDANTYKLVEAE